MLAIPALLGEHVIGPYEGQPKPPLEVVVMTQKEPEWLLYMATVPAPSLNFREISSIIQAYPTLYDLYEAAYEICVTMVSQGNRCTIS